MPEASQLSFGTVEFLYLLPFHMGILFDYHLADSLAVVYGEIILPEVYEYNADLTPIISVDRAGSIGDRESVIQGKT